MRVTIPRIGAWEAWRDAARDALTRGLPPEALIWQEEGAPVDLFAEATPEAPRQAVSKPLVPRSFLDAAQDAVWHTDPERFALLYRLFWRLQTAKGLMGDRGDPDVNRVQELAKNVRRCKHKMKAFVRFREIGDPGDARRSFAAWFEPTHHSVEPTAPFFTRRFADMDWRIVTPDVTAVFEGGRLSFQPGQPKPPLSDDDTEALWTTYFRNIFNPARIKIGAMTSEMPRKYWKNMPETRAIPAMLAEAEARVRAMAEAAPTLPPAFAANAAAQFAAHESAWQMPEEGLEAAIRGCTRCPLHAMATQAVPGEGPPDAPLMIVGEQPGDQEDLAGRPFVGPAGRVLDEGLAAAGIGRESVYMTNAVKHFRFTPKGKRRLHNRPDSGHIEHCRWWLDLEETRLDPRLILALGATAVEALTGTGKDVLKRRGAIEESRQGHPVLITVHPAFLLRLPDPVRKAEELARFHEDLRTAQRLVA